MKNKNDYIYFTTKDGKLIDNVDIANVAKIHDNINIYYRKFDEIRDYARSCKGIYREIKKPSIKILIKNGYKIDAIRIYKRLNECTVIEARDAVNKIEDSIQNKKRR